MFLSAKRPQLKQQNINNKIKLLAGQISEYLAEGKECSNKAIKLIKETKLDAAYKLFQGNTWVHNVLWQVLDKHKDKTVLSAKEIKEDFLILIEKEPIKGEARFKGLKAFFERLKEIVDSQLDITESDYEIARTLQQDEHIIDAYDHNKDGKRDHKQLKNDNAFNKYKDLEGQPQAEYGCWYEPDTIRYLCDSISKTGIINYIFFDDINPNEAFKIQLTRVRSLIEKLARANVVEADTRTICFISKEPGIGQNHFIFCMLSREKDGAYKFLIINPTGESKHKDFYTGLVEFERQTDVKIYITRTVIQKDDGEEGIVSCGPICVELLNHISSLPVGQVNIVLNGSKLEHTTKGEGENAITYNAIDVPDVLLPASLKGVIKAGVEEYKQSIIRVMESHLKSLEQGSTDVVKAREHGQKLLNKFVLGDKAESEKSLVNKILDISKTTQASNNRLKGEGISASNIKATITDNDELIAELMQQDELVSFDTEEKQDKSKQSYVNSSIVCAFHNQGKKKVNNSKKENAFNAYKDLGYWYQELDLIRIGEIILKDKKDAVFVKALGRGHGIQSGNSIDAKAVLKNEQAKLKAGKRLVGLYNTGGNHWIAFIVFKNNKGKLGCRYKDSIGLERSDLKKDLEEAFGEIDVKCLSIGGAEQIEELDNAIAAKGLVSCGIFALKNMNILASCSNIEEYENLKYYTPSEHKKYEAELKAARREYALLYGQKVYEELSNQESPIKALLQELNIKEMDTELLGELAKRVKVEERLLSEEIEGKYREPEVDTQISKNRSLEEQSNVKEPNKIISSANDITPKSSSTLDSNKLDLRKSDHEIELELQQEEYLYDYDEHGVRKGLVQEQVKDSDTFNKYKKELGCLYQELGIDNEIPLMAHLGERSIVNACDNKKERKGGEQGQVKDYNAFNKYKALGYWYQEIDINYIGSKLIAPLKDVKFIGALGRDVGKAKGSIVGAVRILSDFKKILNAEQDLAGTGVYNTGGYHWIAFLLFKDRKNNQVICYYKDSLGEKSVELEEDIEEAFGQETQTQIQCIVTDDPEQKLDYENSIGDQKGLASCGIFALKNMETLAKCYISKEKLEGKEYFGFNAEINKYKVLLKEARKGLGLMYVQKMYEELKAANPESKSLLKDLLVELNVTHMELDEEFAVELANIIKVKKQTLGNGIKGGKEENVQTIKKIGTADNVLLVYTEETNKEESNKTHEVSMLQAKLRGEYSKKESLPRLLEDEGFVEQKIEDTYVTLMLIERKKEQYKGKDENKKDKDRDKNKNKNKNKNKKENAYWSYEDIDAKKTKIEPENIFDKSANKVLLYGRAGAGKTTLCNYISYKWSKGKLWADKFDYVFWLPLRNLSSEWYGDYEKADLQCPLECFIHFCCLSEDVKIDQIKKAVDKEKLLLILDGYDEIAHLYTATVRPTQIELKAKAILNKAISITNPKAKVIMTSRPNAVGLELVRKFDAEIENVGLKKEDVCKYIEQYKFKGKKKTEELLSLVMQHGQIGSIAQVPINLYLLCLIWDKESFKDQIDITVTDLYQKVVEWLAKRYLSKFKGKRLVSIEHSGVEKMCEEEYKLLEELAYCGVKKKATILRKEEHPGLIINWEELSGLREFGILSGKGAKETREYEFIHLTFQEYFAAKHIVKLLSGDLEKVKEAVKFINENKYYNVYERIILFIAGLVTQGFLKQNGKQAMKHFWNIMLNGAIDLGGLKQLGLLTKCLEEGQYSETIPGIDKVLDIVKQYSIGAGLHYLKYFMPGSNSVNRLGIVEDLLNALKNSEYAYTRSTAANALGKIKLDSIQSGAAVEALCNALKDHELSVRTAAANVLGKLQLNNVQLNAVVEALCNALKDHELSVRSAAANVLGKLQLNNVQLNAMVEALCKALEDHSEVEDVGRDAVEALEKLRLNTVQLKTAVDSLCKALKDGARWVRMTAASALGKLKLGDAKAAKAPMAALCRTLKNPYKFARCGASVALEKLKLENAMLTKTVAMVLCKVLEDPEEDVCSSAARALGKLKIEDAQVTKAVFTALYKALEDHSKRVRRAAANALGELKLNTVQLKTAVDGLCKALKDDNREVRMTAASALGKLNFEDVELEKAAVVALYNALGDPHRDVRSAVIYVLGKLRLDSVGLATEMVIALCDALGDDDDVARGTAADTLRKLKLNNMQLEVAVQALCNVLKRSSKNVRITVTNVLWRLKLNNIQSKAVIEELYKALAYAGQSACISEDDVFNALKVESERLQEEVVEDLLTGYLCTKCMGKLKMLEVTSKKVQLRVAEAFMDNASGKRRMKKNVSKPRHSGISFFSRDGDGLKEILEKFAINDISVPFASHNKKLLLIESLEVFQDSAIVLSNNYMTAHYKGYKQGKLVFDFGKDNKGLAVELWRLMRKTMYEQRLPTMLDGMVTGRKWVEIEGIDPELDKLISNRITDHKDDIGIIKDNLELSIISWSKGLNKELTLMCTSESGPQNALESYLEENKSLYSGDEKDASPILMVAMVLAHKEPEYIEQMNIVIKILCKNNIGLGAVDAVGNTVAHYAVKYHRRDVLDACINSGNYEKKIANDFGISILHTAVYYNMVGELDNKLGEQNLDFDKQAESGNYKFTPIELAVAIGNIEAIEKIWDMNRNMAASSEWCRKNILNVAVEFKKDEILHYLIYEKKYKISAKLVQDAYVYAAVSKGEGNINAMRILQGSFVKIYKDCSISKWSSVTGNTALHDVVSSEEMEIDKKCVVINCLLGQEVGLADVHNKNNQTVKELLSKLAVGDKKGEYTRIINILNTKKNIQDSKKHEMPELGKIPIKNLILKGGGPKGIAYVGALREFERIQKEEGWSEIERVAGASAGAITAGLCAIGYSAEELEQDLAGIKLIELLDSPNIDKLMKLKDNQEISNQRIRNLLKEQGSTGHKLWFEVIKAIGEDNGLCTGDKFEGIIERLIEKKTGKKNFTLGYLGEKVRKGEKGYKELYIVTLNILNAENPLVILSTEEENYREIRLAEAIRASMSIPIVFEPKELKYRDKKSGEYKVLKCIDGGVMYNYPIDIFDKVKFRHTGIRGEGQKPIYNEYTMGLSLYSKEVEQNQKKVEEQEVKTSKASKTIVQSVIGKVFKYITEEDLEEVKKEGSKIKKMALQVISILADAESAMSKCWKDNIEVRTVAIDSGVIGLLDFDLSADAIDKLMKEGARTVSKRFGREEQKGQKLLITERRLLTAVGHGITPKSSSIEAQSTSSLSTDTPKTSSTVQVEGLEDVSINIVNKRERKGDCRLF